MRFTPDELKEFWFRLAILISIITFVVTSVAVLNAQGGSTYQISMRMIDFGLANGMVWVVWATVRYVLTWLISPLTKKYGQYDK
jgi:hypothetical protein